MRRDLAVDERLLFRFSALTYNAHRIHYGRPYATSVEGYSGLVVHGPLQAVALAELCRIHARDELRSLKFRLVAPARSYLYVPADAPAKLAKVLTCGADAVILDLEDSVAETCKDTARDAAAEWLMSADPGGTEVWCG